MSNILRFPKRHDEKGPTPPPLINLPPITKAMLMVLIAVHLGLMIPGLPVSTIISQLGFVPARYPAFFTGLGFDPAMIWSPLTHMIVHSGWMHLGMNAAMLAAFGAGLEQSIGAKRFIQLSVIGGLLGALTHFAIFPMVGNVMIGASGAISAQFAAILMVMQKQGRLPTGRYGIWPFAAFWVGISLFFAGMSGFSAGGIAWAAHLGGFVGGFIMMRKWGLS